MTSGLKVCAALIVCMALVVFSGGVHTDLSAIVENALAQSTSDDGVTLKKDNGKGQPGETVQYFNPSEKVLHFAVKSAEPLKSAQIRWVFTAVNTSAARKLKVFDEQGLFTGTMLTARLANESPWPIGRYQGEVFLNDQPWKSFLFEVHPEHPVRDKIEIQAISLLQDDGTGRAEKVVERFKPTDRQLHFMAVTKGIRSETTRVRWVLTAVDTAEGKGLKVAEFELPDVFLNSSTLTSKFSLPDGWPVGRYEVTLFLDSELGKKREFRIE